MPEEPEQRQDQSLRGLAGQFLLLEDGLWPSIWLLPLHPCLLPPPHQHLCVQGAGTQIDSMLMLVSG